MSVVERVLDLLPHYLGMLVLMLLVVGGLRLVVGEMAFWVELLIVLAVAVSYPPLVRRLGIAPESW